MQNSKSAFTLLEVLISIMLLSLVLMALYKSSELLRKSNKHLYNHLEQASNSIKGSQVLYMDILQSDGNITIDTKKEFHKLILHKTRHSLYGLPTAKISWIVHKEQNTLIRVEGNNYQLPLKAEQNVEIDSVLNNLELFKLYKNKDESKILVIVKSKGQKPQSFMVQNLPKKVSVSKKANLNAFTQK